MKECRYCGSTNTKSYGTRQNSNGEVKQRFKCKDCNREFSDNGYNKFDTQKELTSEIIVITSAQNNCDIHHEFFDSLIGYCERRGASLHVIPVKYALYEEDELEWNVPAKYTLTESVKFSRKLRILGNISINPTLENPVAGMDYLSKGDSLIIGHPQLQMKTLAVNAVDSSAIIVSTGSCTEPHYSQTKQGEKARFNHSYSAIVVEKDGDQFHLRVLNADDTGGFYDIDGYQIADSFTPITHVEALITGDEHAIFADPHVKNATYLFDDSIVKTLKPSIIVRHDVLDCYSISHHHKHNFFLKYGKFKTGLNDIEAELKITLNHILATTPPKTTNLIVSSNHHDHLERWLNEADIRNEPWNAKIYHHLMYMMLDNVKIDGDTFSYTQPFELWVNSHNIDSIKFVSRTESEKIFDIEISNHGDVGTNGSRGSLLQYSRLAFKNVIGHSHSPGINKGAYQVGTSSNIKLEYTRGPSSWMHTHCVIYPNGKRQLINILNGRWRK